MGLVTWKNSPDGRVLKSDAQIAKNYLQGKEIKKLERTITGFFDYIENIIENRTAFTTWSETRVRVNVSLFRKSWYTLQKLLTHSDPQMTQRYAHLRDETLKSASDLAGEIIGAAMKKDDDKVVTLKNGKK